MGKGDDRATPARRLALRILHRIDTEGAYANLALNDALRASRLDPRDRGFVTEIVYGTVRWRLRLDWVIDAFSSRSMAKADPWTRNALRMAAYQSLLLDSVPGRVVCYETVALVREFANRGAAGFANAVCRAVLRDGAGVSMPDVNENPVQAIAVSQSHPPWLVAQWIDQLGADKTLALCEFHNRPSPLIVRVNSLQTSRTELMVDWEKEGLAPEPGELSPTAVKLSHGGAVTDLPGYERGVFTPQDEASQLVAHVLRPRAGQTVYDLCSGVGGKSTHLAEFMADRGKITAVDLHAHKHKLLHENCRRLGITSIKTLTGDARSVLKKEAQADAVVLDAPCSGSGVLRRRADLRWRLVPEAVPQLQTLQRSLLNAAADLTRLRGTLLYSTCSIDARENERNVEWFLDTHPEFELRPIETGLMAVDAAVEPAGYLRLSPVDHETDGFFIATLQKMLEKRK